MKRVLHPFPFLLGCLCFMNLSSFVRAQDIGRQSLRGLKGVYLSVERLAPEIRHDGLNEGQIRKEIALKLRKAGIGVLSEKQWFEEPGSPNLYVNAHILKLRATSEYIYSIHIALRQNVYLLREPVEVNGATTWTVGILTGITPKLGKIRLSILEQVAKFIQAYVSINR